MSINDLKNKYTNYLSFILHRSYLLSLKDVLDFIDAKPRFRKRARVVQRIESQPIKEGPMKKIGQHWKSWRLRYFVLLPSLLMQYFTNQDAYRNRKEPTGNIDLTQIKKVSYNDETSHQYSFQMEDVKRIWKFQHDDEAERNEWVQQIVVLLNENVKNGTIPEFSKLSTNTNNPTNTNINANANNVASHHNSMMSIRQINNNNNNYFNKDTKKNWK